MKTRLIEFVFRFGVLISYAACGKRYFTPLTLIALACATTQLFFRTKSANYYVHKNARRATYLWALPHIIATLMVAVNEDYLSLIVAFGTGAFLFTLLIGIIKQGEIKPFAIVEKGTVKRRDIYSICWDTLLLCIIDLTVRYSVINLIFTVLVAVGIIVYTEIALKMIEKTGSEKKWIYELLKKYEEEE